MPAKALKISPSQFSVDVPDVPPLTAAPGHYAGGGVGQLHRMLTDRLAAQGSAPEAFAPHAIPLDERIVRLASRVTGVIMLAIGFAATGWLIF